MYKTTITKIPSTKADSIDNDNKNVDDDRSVFYTDCVISTL